MPEESLSFSKYFLTLIGFIFGHFISLRPPTLGIRPRLEHRLELILVQDVDFVILTGSSIDSWRSKESRDPKESNEPRDPEPRDVEENRREMNPSESQGK